MIQLLLMFVLSGFVFSCKTKHENSSSQKFVETIKPGDVQSGSIKLSARCGSPTEKCERGSHTVGIRYISVPSQSAQGSARSFDQYFGIVRVTEKSVNIFGKLSDLDLRKIGDADVLYLYKSSVLAPTPGNWNRMFKIGELDNDDNIILVPGVKVVLAIDDVRHNIWERYVDGLSDQKIPFLFLTFDQSLEYDVISRDSL